MSTKKLANANIVLDRVRNAYKLDSDAELARFLNVTTGTVSTWRKRDSMKLYDVLANVSDVNLNWLIYGEGPMLSKELANSSSLDSLVNSVAPIPYYKSVVASAGNGIIPEEEEDVIYIALPTPFIHQELATTPKDLFIMQITGDSMEPTIKHSSIIIVNRNHHPPYAGQIYLVRLGESLLCKRIHEMPGHKLNVISDNKRYQDFEIQINDDFEVIGKVVWKVERSI